MQAKKITIAELGTLFKAKDEDNGVVDREVNFGDFDFIALYFSAHWCPPCKGFTPVFSDIYKKWRGEDKKFEVVLISLDNDVAQFQTYYDTQPWIAVPYGDERVGSLLKLFGIQGIPALILITGDGVIVDKNARKEVMMKKDKAYDEWVAKLEKIQSS